MSPEDIDAAIEEREEVRRRPRFTVTSVTASFGRKQNTGDFSSIDVFHSFTATVDGGEPEAVARALSVEAKRMCTDAIWDAKATYDEDWPQPVKKQEKWRDDWKPYGGR